MEVVDTSAREGWSFTDCVECQYLFTRVVARNTNKCSVGYMIKDTDAEKFECVRVNQNNLQSAVRDKTSD